MTDQYRSKIEPYIDGELSASEMHAMDSHIRECTACAAEVAMHLQLKRAVRLAGMRYSNPALRMKIERKISSKASVWRMQWMAVPVLAAVLIALGLFFFHARNAGSGSLYSELTDLHVATLASANPVDVVSTDRHTVKPWFQGKIPFTFNLPELANTEFSLLGGSVTYVEQSPGAHLIYQIRKHEISVFIFQDKRASEFDPSPDKNLSFNIEAWSAGGLRYVVIGDTSAQDINHLADLLKAAAKS